MKIFIVDDQPPETVAMLQALYSRSPKSVEEHLETLKSGKAQKFMAQYYVGYGHKSIGDCGSTSLFIENVSLLAAKAIQDHPLYSGQEASTRYLDMSKQELIDPAGHGDIQKRLMSLYETTLAHLIYSLPEKYPIKEGDDPKVYGKAIKARAFDIARSLLPAGVTTYVAWHTNLRQAYDHIRELSAHPLEEVRWIATCLLEKLQYNYEASFGHNENPEVEVYLKKSMRRFAYRNATPTTYTTDSGIHLDHRGLAAEMDLLRTRPKRAELHQRFRQYGNISFKFPLDFGSYRDLQRQRSCVQEMPLLTGNWGFYPWYIEHLPNGTMAKLAPIMSELFNLQPNVTPEVFQYYVPIGYTVAVEMSCSLPSAVYIAELRSGQTVHPTLREIAQRMAYTLQGVLPWLALYPDMSEDTWTIRRGTQDIEKRGEV